MKKSKSVRIDAELFDALDELREEKGIPVAEQIRRGMWAFIHANEAEEVSKIKSPLVANLPHMEKRTYDAQ